MLGLLRHVAKNAKVERNGWTEKLGSYSMKCPHCRTAFTAQIATTFLAKDVDGGWAVNHVHCAECDRLIIFLVEGEAKSGTYGPWVEPIRKTVMVRPRGALRFPPPTEVPEHLREEYLEACLVLPDSPKASAALSRRCLQSLLRAAADVRPGNLDNEIQQVLDSERLPSHLADSIDAIRNVGNFAAHPIKSQHTGDIVDVEPGEAEWNLDTLELLFDFYYVLPARTKERREALDARLKEAGKPPLR